VERALKIAGSVLTGVLVLTLFTLRLTGLEPADNGANSRPGLWLPGEVVTSPVIDWSFTDKIAHIMVETRTRFFLPYSVTTNVFSRNGQLYMTATYSKGMVFPKSKFWTSNVARDPRVRLKIDGKVYEMTMVLVADRAEAEAVLESKWQKYPGMRPKGTMGHVHVYRVLQRNIPEHGGTEHP
jgi:hypothetical protein